MNNNHGVNRQVYFYANKNGMRVVVRSGSLNSVDKSFIYNGSKVEVDIENAVKSYLERGYTFTSQFAQGINRTNKTKARRVESKLKEMCIEEVVKI